MRECDNVSLKIGRFTSAVMPPAEKLNISLAISPEAASKGLRRDSTELKITIKGLEEEGKDRKSLMNA